MKKLATFILVCLITVVLAVPAYADIQSALSVSAVENDTTQNGWIQKSDGWYFYENGEAKTGWIRPKSVWYYLDDSGRMLTGWQELSYDGKTDWYYFNSEGAMQTGWIRPGSVWYYLDGSGRMATGWKKVDGSWYYFNSGGAMQTGWIQIDGKWYLCNNSGKMLTGWQRPKNVWYYLERTGEMVTGWKKIDGSWYYFNSNGAMQTGWIQVDGKWYLCNNSGKMLTGWQKPKNVWYYLKSSGEMVTGWLKDNGKWYYFNAGGAMVASKTLKIDGKTYAFGADGALITENTSNAYRSYTDSTCSIYIYKKWYAGSWCYCAHVKLKDYKRFGTADAYNSYGSRETVSHAGSRLGALLCINGDYASNPAEPHAAVRRGSITAKGGKNVYACEAYNSNTGLLFNAYEGYCWPGTNTKCSSYTYSKAVSEKLITDTFIFGPAGLNNGVLKGSNGGSSRPRTLIGTNGDPGDLWLVVAAGDYVDGVSAGLTYYEGTRLLQELGCTFGGHIDGGGSSAMWFRGELLVQSGRDETGEGVADFVYVN